MPDRIAEHIEDRSARGIAGAVSRMVTAGALAPGTRLPTVRELAKRLGISPTTVGEAWKVLGQAGVIESRGRLGTFVLDPAHGLGPRRYRRITEGPGHFPLDLSTGTPDPDLLPDLRPALEKVSRQHLTTSYLDDPVLPSLDEALRARWPFVPEAITVVDGCMDALDRITALVVRLGDRVLVEHPAFPPLLDLLEAIGAEPIGLELDGEGIVPAALERGLARQPVALYLQPRAHNPAGVSMTATRAGELARLLEGTRVLVVEDDHAGDIASAPLVSLGAHLPGQTVLLQSFSKSHGPDLRLAAVGGTGDLVEEVASRRLLGPGWSSRLLQAVLVEILSDDASRAAVALARTAYADRRATLVRLLEERGVPTTGADGINLWVEVADEHAAAVALASMGIGVAPGTPFAVLPGGPDHIRVTVGLVRDDHDRVAGALAAAAGAGQRRRRSV